VPDRKGSAEEIMKRFGVVFDYQNNQIYLKKNSDYSALLANKSGVEIQQKGDYSGSRKLCGMKRFQVENFNESPVMLKYLWMTLNINLIKTYFMRIAHVR
jgi:hypothetical protein